MFIRIMIFLAVTFLIINSFADTVSKNRSLRYFEDTDGSKVAIHTSTKVKYKVCYMVAGATVVTATSFSTQKEANIEFARLLKAKYAKSVSAEFNYKNGNFNKLFEEWRFPK